MADQQTPTPQMIFLPPLKPYESPLPMLQLWAALTGVQKSVDEFVGFDFEFAYTADGWSEGIAWNAYAYETEPDEDTEWSGIENQTGRILAHMVGDDRTFSFEPDELTPIADDDYCSCCGQVGCHWN